MYSRHTLPKVQTRKSTHGCDILMASTMYE